MQRRVTVPLLAIACALFAAAAVAAEPKTQAVAAPPPPGMDEPGVAPAPPPAESSVPTAPKNELANPPAARDAKGEPAPEVSVKHNGDDTVEEYRRSGKLYMIRIVPKSGIAQTYMADADGRLVRDPKNGPASPVYYTLYQWK